MISFQIEESHPHAVMDLLQQIPEFENTPSEIEIDTRIMGVPFLVLTASLGGVCIGFKIGYKRDGKFYSWFEAIHPEYRRMGIADALADYQENWGRENGFEGIWMKTRNCFPAMLMMAINRGFRIAGLEPREDINQHRITLQKSL